MVHTNQNIPLIVLRTVAPDEQTLSVYFARPIGFDYEAGDWADINMRGSNPRGGITYSFSSSPTESELAITFKTGISPFKKALQSLEPNDELFISQYGNDYNFYLNENRSSAFIAGGIGIAPFRSMIKYAFDHTLRSEMTLIYMNKGETFAFKDELEMWKVKLPNLHISYVNTKDLNRKKREKLLLGITSNHIQRYFIAGPEGMVESTEHLLINDGVNVKDIRIDSFGGY